MSHLRRVFVCYDLETTGMSLHADQILQFGAAADEDFVTLVRPTRSEIHPRAQAVHGLSMVTVSAAPTFEEAWPRVEAYLQRRLDAVEAAQELVLVGHNSWRFDDRLLLAELRSCGLLERWRAWAEGARPGGVALLSADTLRAAEAARKAGQLETPDNKLGTLYEHFTGQPLIGAHGALADAQAVRELLPHLSRWLSFRPFVVEPALEVPRKRPWCRRDGAFEATVADAERPHEPPGSGKRRL